MPAELSNPTATRSKPDETISAASIRRQQRRLALWILTLIGLLTALVVLANAFLLYRAVPAPYRLSFEGSYRPTPGESVGIALEWEKGAGTPAAATVFPDLLLDGRSPVPLLGQGESLALDAGVPHTLAVNLTSRTSPGLHRGRLVLVPSSKRPDVPAESSQPVAIEVVSGFWKSWFLVRRWAILVLITLCAVWTFAYFVFPPPAGSIRFESPYENRGLEVPLVSSLAGWLFPFTRSTVSLAKVFRKRSVTPTAVPDGEILFVFPGFPPVLSLSEMSCKKMSCAFAPEGVPEGGHFEPNNHLETMSPNRLYRIPIPPGSGHIFFRYVMPKKR
jgi:hypothetical protein